MGFFLQLFGAAHAACHAGHAARGVVQLTRGVGHLQVGLLDIPPDWQVMQLDTPPGM